VAHTKAGGAKAHQGCDVKGKRLGLKVSGGDKVKAGMILIRQRGTLVIPGRNVLEGKDHTLMAKTEGTVKFSTATLKKHGRKIVSVVN
jgi:large subunit ribosomal protein L27